MRDEKSKTIVWVGATLITALLGIAGGLAIATTVLDTGDSNPEATALVSQAALLSEARDQLQDLQVALEDQQGTTQELTAALGVARRMEESLRAQLAKADSDVASALEVLAEGESAYRSLQKLYSSAQEKAVSLETRLTSLQRELELSTGTRGKLEALVEAVEAHRLLLVELRKDIPQTRDSASNYWNDIRSLASTADPALASPADHIILRIDGYYDWSDRTPDLSASSQEYLAWLSDYGASGAGAYDDAIEVFQKDALQAIIGQLDSVVLKLD